MRCWRGTRLIALSLIASGMGVGCLTPPEKPAVLNPDYPALLNLPGGSQPSPSLLSRAQKPDSPSPAKSMLELGPNDPGSHDNRGARIRAEVNGEAILDDEVVAAAYQGLLSAQNENEKADILNKKLMEIIDREVIMQDAIARLGKNGGRFLKELQRIATKEFDKQWLYRMMRANKYTDAEEFKRFLKRSGMPLDMIRRAWERNFIAMEYLRSRIDPLMNKIGHLQMVEYYQKHGDDLRVEDSLTWQDLLISESAGRHASRQAARQFAEVLLSRIRKGEDFVALAKQYDNGDSMLRDGEGIGHKRGEIRPQAIEETLFGMKEGEVVLVEVEVGYRLLKIVKRQYAGRKPFDEKLQKEIREKLRSEIFQQEMKRIVADLKRKAIIEVANEIK